MNKRIMLSTILALALMGAGAGVATVAADPGNGNGPPATVPGSPGGDCSHGNSNQDCRPDPQPTHGQDCEDHGVAQGNEDHCAPVDTTPTDTTPTDTTPTDTTPTETTPTEPTPTVPVTPNDPIEPVTPNDPTDTVVDKPEVVKTPPVVKVKVVKPKVTKRAKTKIVKVSKPKPDGIVIITTADGKKHAAVMGSG